MNKQSLITILLTMLMSMVEVTAFGYDIAVENADGVTIFYKYVNNGTELLVTEHSSYTNYRGVLVIPEDVTYMNRTRKVTMIGAQAFLNCSGLSSITIPNSVTSIEMGAFMNCSGLTSITIPNSVTSIGSVAFYGCESLNSVVISNIEAWCNLCFYDDGSNPLSYAHHLFLNEEEIKDLVIPNSVSSIGAYAFSGCSGLTSVTLDNNVKDIGYSAFSNCSDLTSVTIGNSVKNIGDYVFSDCSGLTSVTIGNNVKDIGSHAFGGCTCLTSVTIGKSVTSIGTKAFFNCYGLTSLTIPNSVSSIGNSAFLGCKGLSSVISLIENPFEISGKINNADMKRTFDLDVFNNVTLYVPIGTIEKYKATNGWKDFLFIEEGTGPNSGDTPEVMKCATPIIGYQNGKLTFISDTEGAICQSTITDSDITSYIGNEVQLVVTYHISVYATKANYENSDVATATLCWIDVEPQKEGIVDGIVSVRANPVLIQSNENTLIVTGAPKGIDISVYNLAGQKVGSTKVDTEATNVITSLHSGEVGIVKIGEKSVKVQIK